MPQLHQQGDVEPGDRPARPFVDDGVPRVATAVSGSGDYSYRPGELLVDLDAAGLSADATAGELREKLEGLLRVDVGVDEGDVRRARVSGVLRIRLPQTGVEAILARLGPESPRPIVGPNTVFMVSALTADPMKFAGDFGADPMKFASAYGLDPMKFANSSSARPAAGLAAGLAKAPLLPEHGGATVYVVDTGVPKSVAGELPHRRELAPDLFDVPDLNRDEFLDIAAGHNTFISELIRRAAPTATIHSRGGLHNDGDGSETDISLVLAGIHEEVKRSAKNVILNLSFSGYYPGDAEPLEVAFWIRELHAAGAVIVAAAGNDGDCRPKYPAAMREVLSVGALGPCAPADFSNHGHWVDASAPGVDLVSEFFTGFDGKFEPPADSGLPDIDEFQKWARWSGTSFATAAVVGALAQTVSLYGVDAHRACHLVVGRSGLFRIPDYGVVVNRIY